MAVSKASWSIRDYSNEKTGFKLNLPEITSANYDSIVNQIGVLNAAVAALTVGNIVGQTISIDTGVAGADLIPTNPLAQREIGVRFFWTDPASGEKGNFTVGCVDMNVVAQQGTDNVDLTLSLVAPIVTAFEGMAVSRSGGAIQITSAKIVGRRN